MQRTFAEASFESLRKPAPRVGFLAEMEWVIPWEGAGRPPVGVKRILRIHFLQHWLTLSDLAVEELLHGQETRVWGDAAYSGQREVIQQHAPQATSFIQAKAYRSRPLSEAECARNRTKLKVRAKVEHVFLVMKQIFGWDKVRYRGLAKNTNWRFVICGLTNLYLARRRLLTET
jgi:IS5 family transposase